MKTGGVKKALGRRSVTLRHTVKVQQSKHTQLLCLHTHTNTFIDLTSFSRSTAL